MSNCPEPVNHFEPALLFYVCCECKRRTEDDGDMEWCEICDRWYCDGCEDRHAERHANDAAEDAQAEADYRYDKTTIDAACDAAVAEYDRMRESA